ncbi:MAG TPA: site-specific integrase [Terriglobales bacterium]|nr:site-specific integrase [Terriglobales bacterium]
MANHKASVWLYVKTLAGWRYCKPVVGRNNKLKPGWAHVNSREEHHPDARYYVRWREGPRTVWKRCESANDAMKMAEFQESLFVARNNGVKVQDEKPPIEMKWELRGYLEQYKLTNRPRSYALMKQTLNEFNGWCRKNLVNHITRLDLLKYRQWLIDRKRTERTASNKMLRVGQFLRFVLKQRPGEGLVTERDGKYEEKEPEVYTDDELKRFFEHCTPFQHAVFKTYLMSGLRRKELENLTWDCVDLKASTLRVEAKGDFMPKTWQQRTVEIPGELVDILKSLPRKSRYVFPTSTGHRWVHSWDDCQEIAAAAKIENAYVHKFRGTCATRLLHGGMDLKTVQRLLGWKSLESAMRYFAKAQSHVVKAKVDSIWGHTTGLTKSAHSGS